MSRNNVKIPAKHYVGMIKRDNGRLPLGYMTPWGIDKAAQNRMSTVDRWAGNAGRYSNNKTFPSVVIDNVPMNGFKVTGTHGHGSSDYWRVEDPRGFELEITCSNLLNLISVGMIDQGEIQDQCVWARRGADNVLLSTATQDYKTAISNTTAANQSASWRDARPGNTVLLQNNLKGVWLGRMHITTLASYYHKPSSTIGENQLSLSSSHVHLVYVDSSELDRYSKTLHFISAPKLSKILDSSTELSTADAECMANQLIDDSTCYLANNLYNKILLATAKKIDNSHYNKILLATAKKIDNSHVKLELVPLEIDSEQELMASSQPLKLRSSDCKVFVETSDAFGEVITYNACKIVFHSKDHLAANEIRKILKELPNRSYSGGRRFIDVQKSYTFDPNDKFYHLTLTVDSPTGNQLAVNI